MKTSKRSNGKKVKLNVKGLTLNAAECCLVGAFSLSWLWQMLRDGLQYNHNETFLADVSKPAK